MKIQHVFFDLDHTLLNFEKKSAFTFKKFLPVANVIVDIDLFLRIYIPINFSYWEKYREEQVTKKELKYLRLKDNFDALKLPVKDEVIHHLSDEYIAKLPNHNHLFTNSLSTSYYYKWF